MGDRAGSCPQKLCVPVWEALARSFKAVGPPSWCSGEEATCQCRRHCLQQWSQGGLSDKMRVWAGLALPSSLLRWWVFSSGRASLVPVTSLSLFLAAPSLANNCSNLPFGTQGRSWSLEFCPQEMGTKKGFHAREPHRVSLSFTNHTNLGLYFWEFTARKLERICAWYG